MNHTEEEVGFSFSQVIEAATMGAETLLKELGLVPGNVCRLSSIGETDDGIPIIGWDDLRVV